MVHDSKKRVKERRSGEKYDFARLHVPSGHALKVSKSQNKNMKSSFLPKTNKILQEFLPLLRAEILAIFRSFFGKNDDFINLF